MQASPTSSRVPSATAASDRGRGGWLLTAALAVLPLALAVVLFSSTLDDDAYITFATARAVVESGDWVNVNGDAVEASSSPLFVALLALVLFVCGGDLGLWAPLVSALAAGVAVAGLHRMGRRVGGTGTAAALLFASSLPLVFWSLSGMETSLYAACVIAVLASWCAAIERGRGAFFGAVLAALGLITVRPEGAPLLVSVGVAWALVEFFAHDPEHEASARRRRAVALVGLALVASALVFLVRRWTYDTWFPQPVTAKVGGLSRRRVIEGLRYLVEQGLWSSTGALALASVVCGASCAWKLLRTRTLTAGSRRAALALVALLASTGFIVTSGGDWMIAGRFLVAPLALAALVVAACLPGCAPTCRGIVVAGICAFQLIGAGLFARSSSPSMPVWSNPRGTAAVSSSAATEASPFERRNRHRLHDVELAMLLGELVDQLAEDGRRPVHVLTGQLGLVPYRVAAGRAGAVRFLDRYGLATRDFTDCEVSASNARGSAGLLVTYAFFFEHLTELLACGITEPEVVFDWSSPALETLLARNGYRIWYRQAGSLENDSELLPGMDVLPHEAIFVRADLAEDLESPSAGALREY